MEQISRMQWACGDPPGCHDHLLSDVQRSSRPHKDKRTSWWWTATLVVHVLKSCSELPAEFWLETQIFVPCCHFIIYQLDFFLFYAESLLWRWNEMCCTNKVTSSGCWNELRDSLIASAWYVFVLLCYSFHLLLSWTRWICGCIVLPLIYRISNYIQFQPFIILLPQWHCLPAGINKVSSNLNLMKLCQTQRGALVALFSSDFKLSLVLRSCCFDIKTDGLLLFCLWCDLNCFEGKHLFLLHLYTSYFYYTSTLLGACWDMCHALNHPSVSMLLSSQIDSQFPLNQPGLIRDWTE